MHYIEYLCFLISENNLDSLPILSTDDLEIVVRRGNKRMPPRPYGIRPAYYHIELAKVTKHRMRTLILLTGAVVFFFSFSMAGFTAYITSNILWAPLQRPTLIHCRYSIWLIVFKNYVDEAFLCPKGDLGTQTKFIVECVKRLAK